MKEIGKLLELLNEYSKNIGYFNEEDLQGQTKAWILSKDFGWIRWLVENDKINKFEINTIMIKSNRLYHGKDKTTADRVDENLEKVLLMLLSISDTPIEDLISYLK